MLCVGVDEAGRGPLVGPVVAAAVTFPQHFDFDLLPGLTDSKKVSAKKRAELDKLIKQYALAWNITSVSAEKIDEINVLQATMLAMKNAVQFLDVKCEDIKQVLIDGNRAPIFDKKYASVTTVIKGDLFEPVISAASILAKVYRDDLLLQLDHQYPQYGFAKHKGYPTKDHLAAIARYGIIAEHRKSYAPIKKHCLSLLS